MESFSRKRSIISSWLVWSFMGTTKKKFKHLQTRRILLTVFRISIYYKWWMKNCRCWGNRTLVWKSNKKTESKTASTLVLWKLMTWCTLKRKITARRDIKEKSDSWYLRNGMRKQSYGNKLQGSILRKT